MVSDMAGADTGELFPRQMGFKNNREEKSTSPGKKEGLRERGMEWINIYYSDI
jgi:hypothetical protein